jgi:hypothetical protein
MNWFFRQGGWKVTIAGAIFGLCLAGFSLPPGKCIGWKGVIAMCGTEQALKDHK